MGFLHESEPLTWAQAMASLQYVRDHGIEQFLSILHKCGDTDGDPFRWGDEVEHQVFSLAGSGNADGASVAKISLRSPEILAELRTVEESLQLSGAKDEETCTWMPEYGRWMLESTPGKPFEGLDGIAGVEQQLALRRRRLYAALRPDEVAPTLTAFPLLGVGDFSEPSFEPMGPVLNSLFVSDEVVFPHPRFPTLAKNIRERRGSKVEIRRPKMKDTHTNVVHQASDFIPQSIDEADMMEHVYADAMPYGMGSSCLQVTMQAANISESRLLYDQLAPLTPLLLALTAATPFLRGWICDDDVRWGQISQSVDDRTLEERSSASSVEAAVADSRLAGSGVRPLQKSRYDGIDCYIGDRADTSSFNDVSLALDQGHVDKLLEGGVDDTLARHVAHLFARDPLVIFGDRLELDDQKDVDHWENLQSTNWQTLRWKPPPPHKGQLSNTSESHIGWRVEFRSMELQMTDFENAAFIAFVVLLSRTILDLKMDFRIPMSKLDENMSVAQRRSACNSERFWFRQHFDFAKADDAACGLMTINEIMNGNDNFIGLIPLCHEYLNKTHVVKETRQVLERYLDFIGQRAEGKLPTPATLMRRFVMSHPSYKNDSRVPEAAAHDLIMLAAEVGDGQRAWPDLLGCFVSQSPLANDTFTCCRGESDEETAAPPSPCPEAKSAENDSEDGSSSNLSDSDTSLPSGDGQKGSNMA
jgi:glutamate--cysteine ligase catalytic subunit